MNVFTIPTEERFRADSEERYARIIEEARLCDALSFSLAQLARAHGAMREKWLAEVARDQARLRAFRESRQHQTQLAVFA